MLAWAQYETGDHASARRHYSESLRLDPNWTYKTNRDAWMLATNMEPSGRNGLRAVQLARRICQATEFQQPEFLDTLAAAYAETGRFSEAVTTVERAINLLEEFRIAPENQEALKARREMYKRHQPYHESKSRR